MKQLKQWCVAKENKVPLTPSGKPASVSDPASWATFDEVTKAGYPHIGFVLAPFDPYTIIDLDNKPNRPATPEKAVRQRNILDRFITYTERSLSGRGYHIVGKGKIPGGKGLHKDDIEVYSEARFMIFTGDVVRPAPIADVQPLIEELVNELEPEGRLIAFPLNEVESAIEDADLVDMAMRAANADKFNDLCNGHWESLGYPSQSEADFALLSMFAFYTPSNSQVKRLFRMSALGRRDKAIKNDVYLDRALGKIRAQEPPPVDMVAVQETLSRAVQVPPPSATIRTPPSPQPTAGTFGGLAFPPGLIGETAKYFLETSVRQVPEIALGAALGMYAGIAGRCFNISQTGLNQYIILIAGTGTGKDGASQSIHTLLNEVRKIVPAVVETFEGPSAFASGQAIIRRLDRQPFFFSILGEFGLTLQQMCAPNAHTSLIMLRRVLLDLYNKSGWMNFLAPSVYSDSEKDTGTVRAPAVTILAETTPTTFFDGLDSSHISEGLIPRFLTIQYTGERLPRNKNAGVLPPQNLVERVASLVQSVISMSDGQRIETVDIDPDGLQLMDAFDVECDREINGSKSEALVQLWNRAHLKALKLAGLVAVGINHQKPVVDLQVASWAIDFVRRDVGAMVEKFRSGEVGTGDMKATLEMRRVIRELLTTDSFKKDLELRKKGVVTQRIIQARCYNLKVFGAGNRGLYVAIKDTLNMMVQNGELVEVPKAQLQKDFKFNGVAYAVGPHWEA